MDLPHLSFETLWDVEFDVGCIDTRKFDVDWTDKMREIPVLQIQQYHISRFKYHKYSNKKSPKSTNKLYYINASVWLLGIIWLFGQNCKNEKYILFIKAVQSTIYSGLINFQVIDFYKKNNWTSNHCCDRWKSEKFYRHFLFQPSLDTLEPKCLNTVAGYKWIQFEFIQSLNQI